MPVCVCVFVEQLQLSIEHNAPLGPPARLPVLRPLSPVLSPFVVVAAAAEAGPSCTLTSSRTGNIEIAATGRLM